jgi:hypothetical protein
MLSESNFGEREELGMLRSGRDDMRSLVVEIVHQSARVPRSNLRTSAVPELGEGTETQMVSSASQPGTLEAMTL